MIKEWNYQPERGPNGTQQVRPGHSRARQDAKRRENSDAKRRGNMDAERLTEKQLSAVGCR